MERYSLRLLFLLSLLLLVGVVSFRSAQWPSPLPPRSVGAVSWQPRQGPWRWQARTLRVARSPIATEAPIVTPPLCAPRSTYLWENRHRVAYTDSGGLGTPVVLIHGFGASIDYWRAQVEALDAAGYRVLALDLVGLGFSDKPAWFPARRVPGSASATGASVATERRYGIELWAQLVEDFVNELCGPGAAVYMVGNSFGSLIALQAAAQESPSGIKVKGIAMVNCAVGMNNKNVAAYGVTEMPAWQRQLFLAVLFVVDIVMDSPLVSYGFANKVLGPAGEETIRETLKSLYKIGPARVDDALVESFLAPARTPGALMVLRKIYTGPPGPTPMALWKSGKVQSENWPLKLIWGSDDALTPLDAGVGLWWQKLSGLEGRVDLEVIPGGHIPHDDNPAEVNQALISWLETTEKQP